MKMYPISSLHTTPMQNSLQKFHDCYLVSSLGALSRSEKGRRILENNISQGRNNYNIKFNNVNGEQEDYLIPKNTIKKFMHEKIDGYVERLLVSPVTTAVELAMNNLIAKHPSKKPFIYRMMENQQDFEYNKPSRFLKMFTGKKPVTLNEGGIRMSLFGKIEKAFSLLKKIEKDKDSVFIAGTGWNMWGINSLPSWHCYSVRQVMMEQNRIVLFDHRKQEEVVLPIQNALHQLKFLTGYFSKDLM